MRAALRFSACATLTTPITEGSKMAVSTNTCAVDGCKRPLIAHRLCGMHYQRYKAYGATERREAKLIRFIMDAAGGDQCVIWPFATTTQGKYGACKYNGRQSMAHRVSLMIHTGPPPNDKSYAAHQPVVCHNTLCVNPRHLRWTTAVGNAADKILDGTVTRGEKASTSGIRNIDIPWIRLSPEPIRKIAEMLSVHPHTIRRIKKRETWGWIGDQ